MITKKRNIILLDMTKNKVTVQMLTTNLYYCAIIL